MSKIFETVSKHVALTAHGREYRGKCPFCGGKSSLHVHTEKNIFHCEKCGTGGNSEMFLRFVKGD